jgi:NADH-quinone oxidoreductase subunit L
MLDSLYQLVSIQTLAWLIAAFPLLGAAANGLIAVATARRTIGSYRSLVSFIGAGLPFLSFAASFIVFVTLLSFDRADPSFITGPLFNWVVSPGLVVEIGLKIDQLSLVMAMTVSGVGALIHLYSVGYMHHDEGYARYFAQLNLFLFFMLLLVLADNLILMFVGWEGVGLCSYLLIGFWFDDYAKARAGTKAFIVNRIGDSAFLAGMFLVYAVMASASAPIDSGYFNFDMMSRYNAYFVPMATVICLLLFAGAAGKSAQIPLYVWLPDAMAGPTPVSALIHAATMVTAGVYMVVRLNFIFALSPFALNVVATIGAVTAIYAATMGLTQTDIKKILAYSTISQLGYMFLAAGVGAFSGAIFHLVTHAFFKALLFLCAGSVIHALAGEQDIRNMGGLRYRMPVTCWTFVVAAAAIAGIAPFSGFFSKDAILWQAFERGQYLLWSIGFLGAGMTAFYIFRAVGMVFFGESNIPVERLKKVHESSSSMLIPMMILAFLAFAGGLIGVPEVLGGANRIGVWLTSLIAYEIGHAPDEGTHATETVLMVITLLWSLHFAVLGWVIYAQKREWPAVFAEKFGILYRLAANKYYVDEIYDFLFVRPINWISRRILWQAIDDTYIDGLAVHGTARSFGFWASVVSLAQTGALQQYLLYFLIGAVLIVGYLAL